jgi:LCP family protein required for cell wall assembly
MELPVPQRPRVGRVVLAALSSLILVLSITGWAVSERYMSGLKTVDVFGGLAGNSAWNGEPVNVLIVGSDARDSLTRKQRRATKIERTDAGRHTDTMLLAHIGGDLGRVTVVSIPRDSLVEIPAHVSAEGQRISAHRGKVNSAFATGGPAVTVQTVQNATGLTIDHYVEVDFGGFLSMVDAVDGVEVCLEKPLYDQRARLDLPAGRQTIQGPQALAYVRARYIDNDFGRSQRQQRFLSAMAQKVSGSQVLLNPVALNAFLDAAVSSLTTDERLTREDMVALATRAADLDLGQIVFTTVPVSDGDHMYEGESTVLWDPVAAPALFDALRADQPLPKPPKTAVVQVAPDEIDVSVSGDPAAAERAVADLEEAGYRVVQGGKPDNPVTSTTVQFDPAWPNSADTLKASLPGASFTPEPGMGGVFRLSVAPDYAGLSPVRAAATSLEQQVRSAKDDICS